MITHEDPPKHVTVHGCGYRVTVHEDAVIFTEEEPIYGCRQQIIFDRRAGCWHVRITGQMEAAMAAHIAKMTARVSEWFGGDHECSRGENRP